MRIEREDRRVRYTSVRREGQRAISQVEVEVGDLIPAAAMSDLDHFLVSRWRLYSAGRRGLVVGRIDHPPWALREAELVDLRQDLLEAAGLPRPEGAPLVRYAAGVGVRIAPPARAKAR